MAESNNLIKRKNKETAPKEPDQNQEPDAKKKADYRYGPMPRFPTQRVWSRSILIVGVMVYIWYTSSQKSKDTLLAKQGDVLEMRSQPVDCDSAYLEEIHKFPGCFPKRCARYVSDKIVTAHEATTLLNLAKRGMALGGSEGGASIFDLHSGALSYGTKFINVSSLEKGRKVVMSHDLAIYKLVRKKIQNAIAQKFDIREDSLYLTHPTFFSKLTSAAPKTEHDEYWHMHVDKETYETFHYTSLLYLTDYGRDFKGGRFFYANSVSKPTKFSIVEPRKGRVSFFTSGAENPHYVEAVTEGERYAITISFTCNKAAKINDPVVTPVQ